MVLRRSWGRLALAWLLLGAAGCGGGPGTFELVLDPAAITIPPGTLDSAGAVAPGIGDIDVLIRCGTNKNLFVIVLALAGVPDESILPFGSAPASRSQRACSRSSLTDAVINDEPWGQAGPSRSVGSAS